MPAVTAANPLVLPRLPKRIDDKGSRDLSARCMPRPYRSRANRQREGCAGVPQPNAGHQARKRRMYSAPSHGSWADLIYARASVL